MKLQTKIALSIIPLVLLGIFTLGIWSIDKAKESTYKANLLYMDTIVNSYLDDVNKIHNLLTKNGLDKVDSFVSEYKLKALKGLEAIQIIDVSHMFIFNSSGELIFCSNKSNKNELESVWGPIAKESWASSKIESELQLIPKGIQEVYVVRHFKPWNWVVFFSMSDSDFLQTERQIRNATMGIASFCSLLLILLVLIVFRKFFVSPIHTLAKAASAITDGQDIKKIDVLSSDELGDLARNMEVMSKAIQSQQAEIKKSNIDLENRIEKATSELKKTNRELNQEIEDRKNAEKSLLENEAYIRAIMDNLPIGVAVNSINPSVTFSYMNNNFPKFYRTTRKALEDPDIFWDSVYEDPVFREKIKKRVLDDCASGDPKRMKWDDLPITRKGEETVFISASNTPLPDKQLMISTVWDVTLRKRAEEALQKSESKYKRLSENSPAVVYQFRMTPDGEFTFPYISNAVESIMGVAAQKVLQSPSEFLDMIHPEDQNVFLDGILESAKSLELYHAVIRYLKDGEERWVEARSTPNLLEDGSVLWDGFMVDITEKKIAEKEKIKLEDQLQQAQKMESIGTLAGGIAHDFNNILAIIFGNTELALEDVPEHNPSHSNLQEIKKASLRATDIVRQLLNFTRITDQKLQPIKIALVIKDSLKFLKSTIPTTIDIEQDIQITDETILADSTQINQIMMNLCINASHAMEQTGGDLAVTVEKVILDNNSAKAYPDLKSGAHVKIMISDTGPGIDPEIIDQIFDPYFTTKGVGKGSGMGLAVVHGIVKNHNGTISVDSSLGKGTKFIILFPLATEKLMVEANTNKDIPRGNETLLFVDDELSIVKMVQKMFERLGYKVEAATTPQDALERFSLNPDHFDLVITDMTMPQMTGVKLSEKLMEIRPDIPIIICTGHSALVDEEKAKELGLAAYVTKPISMLETAQTIRKVLDRNKN